jgi:hypothetical protein
MKIHHPKEFPGLDRDAIDAVVRTEASVTPGDA